MITLVQLTREIERGIIAPVYLFLGGEEGSKESIARLIQDKLFGFDTAESSQPLYYYSDEVSAGKIAEECATFSLIPQKKLVIVKNVENLETITPIIEYCKRPNPETVLLLLAEGRKVTKALQATVEEVGRVTVFWNLFHNQGEKWVTYRLSEMGIQSTEDAVKYIVEVSGTMTYDLANQLSLIEDYLNPGENLDLQKVKEIISKIVGYTVFDLTNSLFLKSPKDLITIFRSLVRDGEELVKIHYFCWLQMVKLLEVHQLAQEGKSFQEIKQQMGFKKLEAQRMRQLLSRVSMKKLLLIISKLARLDYIIKTSPKVMAILEFEKFLLEGYKV